MSGRRIYEVAKDLGVSNKELIQRLNAMGVDVKVASNTISEDVIARVKKAGAEQPAPPAARTPAPPSVPAPATSAAPAAAPAKPPAEAAPAPARSAEPEPPRRPAPATAAGSVPVQHGITIREFAEKAGLPPSEVIKVLMRQGSMKAIGTSMTDEEVLVVADELGVKIELVSPEAVEELRAEKPPAPEPAATIAQSDGKTVIRAPAVSRPAPVAVEEAAEPRPPVVTVMGHVDHGKTSILDKIRQANVAAGEAGGITQHIGAYQVVKDGHPITFIDTPGHEAFTAMRARGAQSTDIAVLVVAADDGVMPQTLEAIDHARAAGVPIIVAVNKIDREESDATRVRTQLAERGLQPQEWGGDTLFVDVSARTGANIEELLVGITLIAEDLDLRAVAKGPARGIVLESRLDKGRGAVATVLVRRGTLKVGDAIVAGTAWGKVRAMEDEDGERVKAASPARPVLVLGWSSVPQVGSEARAVADEKQARQLAQDRDAARRQSDLVHRPRARSLDELFGEGAEGELNLIIKADVQGSVEALSDSFQRIEVGEVRLNILHKGVGAVTENDIALAKASKGIVIAFNVAIEQGARQTAEAERIDVRQYRVIYQAIEDVEKALKGLLAPEFREAVLGAAEIRRIFKKPGGVRIAGCYVTSGELSRNARVRLIRDGAIAFEGRMASLRHVEEDVTEIRQGFECGILLQNYNDIKERDVIEAFEVREIARS